MKTDKTDRFSGLRGMLAEKGIEATDAQLAQFRIHYDLLLKWNAKTNLTAIRTPEEILRRHFVESAYLTKAVEFGAGTLVDVGSGAGFPGIPVKVLCPQTRVVLVESIQKKAAFLKEVARAIGVSGLEVTASRAEELDIQAQWVTMRAVRLTPAILHTLKRLVPRGTLALFTDESPGPDWRAAGGRIFLSST